MHDLTPYHAKYIAYELTRRCPSDSPERLAGALLDAKVDLNPHQLDAALFAFQSPLSRGALLADEVGLGKTIEAGLVVSQKWAERKRRILIITPANLRKQWYQEITQKFFLPCAILEDKSHKAAHNQGNFQPFEMQDSLVICSYNFAKRMAGEINAIKWDLVVIDEAHRLRNVYKPTNIIANVLKKALANYPKLLLTATPLQNSLLELYGLISFIDDHTFGDLKSFKDQFARLDRDSSFQSLRTRIRPLCHRTLRRQVEPYIQYTKRHPLLQKFTPDESEDRLYNAVSDYLHRDNLRALPASQRSLMTLVLRKLLASSTFAIAGALETMVARLRELLAKDEEEPDRLLAEMEKDFEALEETEEEWDDEEDEEEPAAPLSPAERAAIAQEIADLESFRDLALSIKQNAKGRALIVALERAFAEADRLGGARKAIIFTESRKTQSYLLRLLAESPWRDGIVLFNGTNTDPESKAIYNAWLARNKGTDAITGSRTADMRSALVDYFRNEGKIMIATEAGAEGINLQFCSLVVNYDLPWNPQRIEQRIGRCHRYGQKHDVVVVNFLNEKNEADRRVYDILHEKFKLFAGVFGASDEVLGAIEAGVDFEKRIAAIYQRCRRPDEIESAFAQLQQDLEGEIGETMASAHRKLLENFDEEVHEKLRLRDIDSGQVLKRFEQYLMQLTRFELDGLADFDGESRFILRTSPFPGEIALGAYELPRRSGDAHLYRLNHPLAEALIARAKARELPPAEIHFDYAQHGGKIAALAPYLGKSGWLTVTSLTIEALDQVEDHLIVSAMTDDGEELDPVTSSRLLGLPGRVVRTFASINEAGTGAQETVDTLTRLTETRRVAIQQEIGKRNARYVQAEADKLEAWADDMKLALERDIKDLDRQIKEARRAALAAPTLEEKLAAQKVMRALDAQRSQKRRSLFDAQDALDKQRDDLIAEIERKLSQCIADTSLLSIRWFIGTV